MPNDQVSPFLKWPGGKRLLVREIVGLAPRSFRRYFEPFVGSGALFFSLKPTRATLADLNGDLINVYRQVKDNADQVIERLSRLRITRDFFYKLRAETPNCYIDRAVRFLYLNRTAFNGIYRVNRQGQFNVPFGCKPGTVICDSDGLRRASAALAGVKLTCADFAGIMRKASAGDFIYADPPYTTMHDRNGFRRYNESIFSWSDQQRLATAARDAVRRGAAVAVSNAHHPDVIALYPEFQAVVLERASCIASNPSARKSVSELLFISSAG